MVTHGRSLVALPALGLALAGSLRAQLGPPRPVPPDTTRSLAAASSTALSGAWGFGVGESFEYAIAIGPARVGRARLGVEDGRTVGGSTSYRVAMEVEARIPFFGVDDRWESWLATDPLRALGVVQRVEEGDAHRHERFEIDYDAGRITAEAFDAGADAFVPLPTDPAEARVTGPVLDDVGFLYLLRTLPLEPGREYRFESHFLTRGNPVVFRVLGREEIRVPAGRFSTIVVEPMLPGMGILSPGADARAYLTDDSRRLLVRLTTETRFGTVALHLRRYEPGEPVESRTPASEGDR